MKPKKTNKIIYLGGEDGERLYLHDLKFKMPDGQEVKVEKNRIPGMNMNDLVARHVGRYGPVTLFCRPGSMFLDFPCGSGYAADFLKEFGIIYHGKDVDKLTVEYARGIYGS